MCSHQFILTDYCKICTLCGLQKKVLCLETFNQYSAPISKNYSRAHRFKLKTEKLLLINSGPSANEAVWQLLETHRDSLHTVADVRLCLRASDVKNKHYDCVRLFSKIFCNINVDVTDVHGVRKNMLDDFNTIYHSWTNHFDNGLFFSSDWLLRHLINKHCPKLHVFLKPKTSKCRDLKYINMLQTISKCW